MAAKQLGLPYSMVQTEIYGWVDIVKNTTLSQHRFCTPTRKNVCCYMGSYRYTTSMLKITCQVIYSSTTLRIASGGLKKYSHYCVNLLGVKRLLSGEDSGDSNCRPLLLLWFRPPPQLSRCPSQLGLPQAESYQHHTNHSEEGNKHIDD